METVDNLQDESAETAASEGMPPLRPGEEPDLIFATIP